MQVVDYSIVRITIISRKQAGDISGRADTGIWHGIFRKYEENFIPPPLNGIITQQFLFLT